MISCLQQRPAWVAMRWWLLLCCIAAFGCVSRPAAGGRSADTAATDAAGKPLRVGVAESAPPLIFMQDDEPAGIEADLARALAEELGRKLEFVSIWWPNLNFELRKNRIDIIMAGMSITPERERDVAFAQPYMEVGQMAIIRASERDHLPTAGAVHTRAESVGVEEGTTGEIFARTHLLLADVHIFPTVDAAIRELLRGDIEAVIYDSPSARWLVRKRASEGLVLVPGLLTHEQLAWAVNPDNQELLREVNAVLARWKSNGRLDEILRRWLPEQ